MHQLHDVIVNDIIIAQDLTVLIFYKAYCPNRKWEKNRTYHLPQSRHRHFRHKIQSFLLYRSQESYTDFCFEEVHHLFHLIREWHGIIKKLSTVSIK